MNRSGTLLLILCTLAVLSTLAFMRPAGGSSPPQGQLIDYTDEYQLYGLSWDHTCLTYATPDDVLAALMEQSFARWNEYSPIRSCGRVNSGEDIFIRYSDQLGANILGVSGTDGIRGSTITHSFIYIDRTRGAFLGVVAHELGHSLGLGHSQLSNQLMSPYCCNDFGDDDIAAIRAVYGPNPLPPPLTPSPVPTPVPTKQPTPVLRRVGIVPALSRD